MVMCWKLIELWYLSLIELLFERVVMHLVRPLPKSAKENQHILVIFDFTTCYPEAIHLRNIYSKIIVKERFHIFGTIIPKQIMTEK